MSKKRVVVLGGGFAGLAACRTLNSQLAEVTLIDRKNHHLFQPLLYQVATSTLSAPNIAEPLRDLVRSKKNVTTYLDEVTAIDLAGNTVTGQQRTYPYDYLILALGARTGYFGNNHWAEHTHCLKSLDDALGIRQAVLKNYEKAELETDPAALKKLLTIVVVGGGPTGLEMAGSLAELSHTVLKSSYRNFDPADTRVILIEAAPRLLPPFPEALSEKARQQIITLGVDVRLNTPVKEIRPEVVVLEKETIESAIIVWAAGVEAVPITKTLGVKVDRGGRIEVEHDCSIPGFKNAFAVGDLIRLIDINKVPVPGVSPAAVQTAQHAAKIINQEIGVQEMALTSRPSFAYWDKGSMAIIGKNLAVAKIGPVQFSGFFAWVTWLAVHLLFLENWWKKAAVASEWIYNFFTNKRSSRVFPH